MGFAAVVGGTVHGRHGDPDREGERGIVIIDDAVDVFLTQQFTAAVPPGLHRAAGRRHALGQSLLAVRKIAVRPWRFERHLRNATGFREIVGQCDEILVEHLQQRGIDDRAFRIDGRNRHILLRQFLQRTVIVEQRLQFGQRRHRNGREAVRIVQFKSTLADHAEFHRHVMRQGVETEIGRQRRWLAGQHGVQQCGDLANRELFLVFQRLSARQIHQHRAHRSVGDFHTGARQTDGVRADGEVGEIVLLQHMQRLDDLADDGPHRVVAQRAQAGGSQILVQGNAAVELRDHQCHLAGVLQLQHLREMRVMGDGQHGCRRVDA